MHFDAGLRTVEGSSWKSLEAGILHEMKESYEFRFTNSIIGIHLFSARPGSIEAGFTINYTSIDSYQLIYLQDSIESDLGIGKMAIVSGSSWNYVSNIVPSSAPPNITITSNTPTSLNVTWKRLPTSQQNGDVKGYLLFYREKLYLSETYQVFSTRDMHQEITGLKPFTKYVMRLLAYTSAGNGVASDLLTAVTMETTPSQPPTKINGFAINSTAVFLEWMGVPVEHISGIPVGYLVFYEQDGMVFNMTQDFNTPNMVIVGLHASTQYIFTVCACNKVGDGPCDSTEITTASSVPTTIPTGLTLTHRDHDVATLKWTQATTYDFDGYKLQYQLIERNNEVVRNSETVEIHLAPSMTSYTINFLKSNSKYLVLLFAYNAVGSGRPASLTMETCRCREYVEANYFFKPPYVFQTAKTEQLSGIVPVVINNLIHNVCGFCARAGNKRTTVDFVSNGKFGFSCKPNINRVVEDIDDFTEISFPLSSNPIPDDNGNISSVYVPLLKYPGAVLILRDDGMASYVTKIVADIFKVWPIFLLNIILILISGILIWALENYRSADNDFSTNIIKGMCQGLYWAYVTQTTLGYGDITPRKVSSRVLAICWITLSLVMTSLLLGALTSTFTAVQTTKSTSVYGLKVAALSGSFEERLALLRNGKVDKSARYSTVHDLLSALNSGHVSGILLDVYTAASNKDILNNEEYRAVNLLKFPRTYGVVFSGTLANVERLAVDYVAAHQTEILAVVDDFTENIVLQKKIKEKSIFDPRSKFLHRFLLALVITLVVFIVIGYSGWWFVVKRRRLRTVYPQNLSEHLKREKEMLQHLDQITHNFYQTFRHKIDTLFSRMQTERVKLRLDRGASSLRANHSYKLYMSKQNKALELAEFRFLDTDTDSSRKTEKPASKNGNKSENISTEMCNRLKTPFTPDTSCGDLPQCSNFDANDITISEIDDNSW
ncbi:uncharacterized protein LOC130634855 isoform X2 [Hydractinia symbiolongicarpus]|uniref:uncharacterized protein LOC130634855 isoform X2 n=1 Tax=Hydractinia symbiolongicarpus TaxID=13093 RepID=UPI00254E90E4|nr:uncharacterized protein LOC130634855 isoform X2 [Hydractinia symbiolongicarpus]